MWSFWYWKTERSVAVVCLLVLSFCIWYILFGLLFYSICHCYYCRLRGLFQSAVSCLDAAPSLHPSTDHYNRSRHVQIQYCERALGNEPLYNLPPSRSTLPPISSPEQMIWTTHSICRGRRRLVNLLSAGDGLDRALRRSEEYGSGLERKKSAASASAGCRSVCEGITMTGCSSTYRPSPQSVVVVIRPLLKTPE